jgi:hypothetical protein
VILPPLKAVVEVMADKVVVLIAGKVTLVVRVSSFP